MLLTELYKQHFLEAGAYQRNSWPSTRYLYITSRPGSYPAFYNGTHYSGNIIDTIEQIYRPYSTTDDDMSAIDWTWIDQETLNNLTTMWKVKAKRNEDSIV